MGAKQASQQSAVMLRDGSRVTVRPVQPTDRELVRGGFERLSDESRHRRFLSPLQRLTESALTYLTNVDHHDHEALIALDADGAAVGLARYVRSGDSDLAEAAVVVIDEWQGRGLGTALLTLLAERGRAEGVSGFTALVLASNKDMLDLLRGLGPVRVVDRDSDTVEVVAELPPAGLSPQLHDLLRGWAAGDVNARRPPS